MNEQELCKKRLIDLSRQADRKGIVLFSDFLNLNELNIYHQSKSLFASQTESFGGVPYAERQMIAFLPDALYYDWDYPIAVLKIDLAYPKFAETLGHRDILGSIMSLGVDRGKFGDILCTPDGAYLFCEESMADYLMENLIQVRHTLVHVRRVSADEIQVSQQMIAKDGIITSNRLDALIACVLKLSRSRAQDLIKSERVFVNGKSILSPVYSCNAEDIVSVRGFGRFIYAGSFGETGKGRIKIKYRLYQN